MVFWWPMEHDATSQNKLYLQIYHNFIQVSKIEGCELVLQGDLPFDYWEGSCNTFLEPTPRILLCFGRADSKVCHTLVHNLNVSSCENCFSFDGENYVRVEETKYSHRGTLGLGNYRGKAFTTGCSSSCTSQVATELLDMTTMKWSDGPYYPFAPSS